MKQSGAARKSAMGAARAKRNAAVQRDMEARRDTRSKSGAAGAVQRMSLDDAFADAKLRAAEKLARYHVVFYE